MSYPATAPQLSLIGRLVSERSDFAGVTDIDAFVETLRDERLTKQGAGALIDHLFASPVNVAPVTPKADKPVDARGSLPANRYAGDCALCGQRVPAQAGTYRKGARGGWDTLHLPGDCPDATTIAEVVASQSKTEESWAMAKAVLQAFPAGYYAVPSVTGVNDFTFFAVKINQGRVNPSKKGEHYFALVVGGHGEGDIKVNPSYILKCVEAAKAVGLQQAGEQYAANFSLCYRCGAQLTDEASRARGTGPECAKRGW